VGWTTVRLQVTTPLFNGGATPEDGAGPEEGISGDAVRVASLRGAMRFWFRALAGLAVGPKLHKLAAVERRVFGGTDVSSPVKLRILDQPPLTPPGQPEFAKEDGRWIVYLLGQGLGDLRFQRVRRPYVAPGEHVSVQFRVAGGEPEGALVLASLWLLCAYGGLGARTRRGFGGLRIVDVDGPLPAPWTPSALKSPNLAHYEKLTSLWPDGSVGACMRILRDLVGGDDFDPSGAWSSGPPTYPVLSRSYAPARTSGGKTFPGWDSVLAHAGEQLRYFRAEKDYPNAGYRPRIKTPEWDEVVRGQRSRFALGALGLPVVYKDGYEVHADLGRGSRSEKLRRASPLWLRPVGGDKDWRLLSFAFQGEFLPEGDDGPAVHVWKDRRQDKPVVVSRSDVVDRTGRWIDAMGNDASFKR
jgi:CRISPR-associated protein Cmr1